MYQYAGHNGAHWLLCLSSILEWAKRFTKEFSLCALSYNVRTISRKLGHTGLMGQSPSAEAMMKRNFP